MTRPKNLNTQYGRQYLNYQKHKEIKPREITIYQSVEEYLMWQEIIKK